MVNNILASIMALLASFGISLGGSSIPALPSFIPSPAPGHHAPAQTISQGHAEDIALGHAGAPRHEVRWDDRELDWDDGTPEWEIEFHWRGWEYEYEINAWNGHIINWEREWDD